MRKKEEDQSARLIRCGLGILLGGVLALLICCLFLLGVSVAISSGFFPPKLSSRCAVRLSSSGVSPPALPPKQNI